MKSKIIIAIIGGIVVLFVVAYFLLAFILSIPSITNPFYEKCLDVSQGMEHEEVKKQLQDFLDNSAYKVEKKNGGTYGWKGRLSYDESLTIVLEDEPWYKIDQHPWRCEVLFKDGLVINVEPFFD